MGDLLVPIEFALEMLPSLERFTYGREPWEVYLHTWLMKGSADAIGSGGAKVWVYINQADEYVGYGSLAQSLLRYPRKKSDMVPVVDIPAFAVRDDLWGKPKEDRLDDVTVDGRYSSQIMRHLIDTPLPGMAISRPSNCRSTKGRQRLTSSTNGLVLSAPENREWTETRHTTATSGSSANAGLRAGPHGRPPRPGRESPSPIHAR